MMPHGSVGRLNPNLFKKLGRGIATTRPDEIWCDECFGWIDRFGEMVVTGEDAGRAMPLVQDHLDRCGDCRKEFEALLTALSVPA